jgi:hypothetical protein
MSTLIELMQEGGTAMWALLLLALLAPLAAACGALLAGTGRWSPAFLWWGPPALLVAVGALGRWSGQAMVVSVLAAVDPERRSRILHAGLHEAIVPEMSGLFLAALALAGSAPLCGLGLALGARGGRSRPALAGALMLGGLCAAAVVSAADVLLAGGHAGLRAFVAPLLLLTGGVALGLAALRDGGDPGTSERLAAGRVLVASLVAGSLAAAWVASADAGFKVLHRALAYAEPGMFLAAPASDVRALLPAAGGLALALVLGALACAPGIGALRHVRTWASALATAGALLLVGAAVAAVHAQAAGLVGRTAEALLERALTGARDLPRSDAVPALGAFSAIATWDGRSWRLDVQGMLPAQERLAVVAPGSMRAAELTGADWVVDAEEVVHVEVIVAGEGEMPGSLAVDLVPAAGVRDGGLLDPAGIVALQYVDGFGLHQGQGRYHRAEDLTAALDALGPGPGGDPWRLLLVAAPASTLQDLVDACTALGSARARTALYPDAAPAPCAVTGSLPDALLAVEPPAPEVGIADLAAPEPGAVAEAGPDSLVLGSLDRSAIDAVIRRHLNEIRYCYERGLTVRAALNGKVVVKFVIAKDGTVSSAAIKSSTLNDPEVEGCVAARFLRMRFPAPKGGGIVIVSYPFVFAPG